MKVSMDSLSDNVLIDFDFDSFLHDNNTGEEGTFDFGEGFMEGGEIGAGDTPPRHIVNKPASVIRDFSVDAANPLDISTPLLSASPQDKGGSSEGGIGEPHTTKPVAVDKAFPTANSTFSMLTSLYYE